MPPGHQDPVTLPALGEWAVHAGCRGANPDLFVSDPWKETPEDREHRESIAKRYCYACPVQESCREYALQNRPAGIWGGLTDKERRQAGARTPARAFQPVCPSCLVPATAAGFCGRCGARIGHE